MILEMEKAGISIEKHHHEVATAGQAEIDIRFDSLVKTADKMMMYKYIVKNVARRHGKTATFMPKPIFGDNGSGMHTHQSIWKDGKPLFAGKEYAGVSQMCLHYIGGILKHAPALAAFTNPTTNSYKRLTPGFEAPVLLAYSSRNRSAGIRIPMYSPSPKAKRIEVRFPDPGCQSVSRLCRHVDGGTGRDREQDQSGRTGREGSLRSRGEGSGQDSRPCRAAWMRRSTTSRRITNSCSRAGSLRRI